MQHSPRHAALVVTAHHDRASGGGCLARREGVRDGLERGAPPTRTRGRAQLHEAVRVGLQPLATDVRFVELDGRERLAVPRERGHALGERTVV